MGVVTMVKIETNKSGRTVARSCVEQVIGITYADGSSEIRVILFNREYLPIAARVYVENGTTQLAMDAFCREHLSESDAASASEFNKNAIAYWANYRSAGKTIVQVGGPHLENLLAVFGQ
jgi:hypothetical protein